MNKKEVGEIKKLFTLDRCCIQKICGCYVDGEKEKRMEMHSSFLILPEEEQHKYFDIFKKTLSGSVGKNLLNMEFPLAEEEDGGKAQFLYSLRESHLEDVDLLEEFYDKIIENYDYVENYFIILIECAYDIPGKAADHTEMFDASDEVYDFLLCSICPVNLSKAGLCYNTETNLMEDRIRDWIVAMPEVGFLYPVFNDRSTDIHGMLYYSKNANKLHGEFVDQVFGCVPPLPAGSQKDYFNQMVEETLGEDCNYDAVLDISEKLNEIVEASQDSPDPLILTKPEVRRILEECGAREEKMEQFDQQFGQAQGEQENLVAANVFNRKRFEIRTPDVSITVEPERAQIIERRMIDGRPCLVIPMENEVEVNGIRINSSGSSSEEETDEESL